MASPSKNENNKVVLTPSRSNKHVNSPFSLLDIQNEIDESVTIEIDLELIASINGILERLT